MAVISFFGAKGAPGVTSTAALVAALWPRPTLLVDADGVGGDLLVRLVGEDGAALHRHPGLLTLLPLARHGLLPGVVLDHTQVAMGGQRVLVGVERPEQAEAAGALWATLAACFADLPDTDVVIDAGQLHARSGQLALVQRSDLVVGVLRPEPSSVVHMRHRLGWLTGHLATLGAQAPRTGLVCIEAVRHGGEAATAVATAAQELTAVLDLGRVAHDPKAVRMFHGEPVLRPERTLLVRSGRTLVGTLAQHLPQALPADPPQEPEATEPGEPSRFRRRRKVTS